jgi:hypothetical protein
VVGTALTSAGTRVVAGRALPAGGARLVFLTKAGPEAFRAQPDTRAFRLLEAGGDAVLVAGAPGAERTFTLRPLEKGAAPPAGGIRFVPVGRPGAARWAAVPLAALVPPPGVTAVAEGGGALYFGTERMGVARGAPGRPRYLSGAELVGDADRLFVACASRQRCFVVTEGPRAWRTDGDSYAEARVGESDDGRALAVVSDPSGALYALWSEGGLTGIAVSKLDPGDGDGWKPFLRASLRLPVPGPPAVSLAAISPGGILWVGVRAGASREPDESFGFGAVEIDLRTRSVVQHRPLGGGEHAKVEALPIPASLTGLFFDGSALWFSSLSGVSRWSDGKLSSWGENERMPSEIVHALGKGPDGKIWAATSDGLARFDGREWRGRVVGDVKTEPATRALVRDGADRMWLATANGLRVIEPADAAALRPSATVVEGDVRDVVLDRFGRVWALGAASIALVDAPPRDSRSDRQTR